MAEIKTKATENSVDQFLDIVEPKKKEKMLKN